MELEELKAYCRIDYDDDDEVIKLIYAAVLEEMTDLIKDFNPEALTNRQKLLICMYVKEAYDNRDRTAPTDDKVRFAVQSMMLKERLYHECWCEIGSLYGKELYKAIEIRLEDTIVFDKVRYCKKVKEIAAHLKDYFVEYEGEKYNIFARDFRQNDKQYVQLKANRVT